MTQVFTLQPPSFRPAVDRRGATVLSVRRTGGLTDTGAVRFSRQRPFFTLQHKASMVCFTDDPAAGTHETGRCAPPDRRDPPADGPGADVPRLPRGHHPLLGAAGPRGGSGSAIRPARGRL